MSYSISSPQTKNEQFAVVVLFTVAALLAPVPGARAADAVALEGTYWRLAELDGNPVTMEEGQPLPHIALHSDTARVAGFGGCNRFFGQYSTSESGLSITPLGGGRASCGTSDRLERTFISALAGINAYEIHGSSLRLFDGERLVLAFRAVAE